MTTLLNRVAAGAIVSMLLPLAAMAQPVITGDFAFTERRSATSLFASDYTFVIGASSITPSGPGTSASATHVPGGTGPDYTLPFVTGPQSPDQYARRVPYTGQTGQWRIAATDAGGTTTKLTHVLNDVRDLPLITGLTVSGAALTPHLTWDPVDPKLFPSFCGAIFGACALGYDFFNYQVEVRVITGTPGNVAPLAYSSLAMPTSVPGPFTPAPTVFNIPGGVLSTGNDYLIGIRLIQNELEAFLPDGHFFSPLENRSTAYVSYTAPIPEPETYAMLLAGLGLLGFAARCRAKKETAAS
jgi:hypothetical protein